LKIICKAWWLRKGKLYITDYVSGCIKEESKEKERREEERV
jgi:hypothetical protein